MFPAYIAREAFEKALISYRIWEEPLGFQRWVTITNAILSYQATMLGRKLHHHAYFVYEQLHTQLSRTIKACPEQQAGILLRDFTNFNIAIEMALDQGHDVTLEMYQQACHGFIAFLTKWLNRQTYESTFGHKQSTKLLGSSAKPQINHISARSPNPSVHTTPATTPPSYATVTKEGGQGPPPTKLHTSAASKQATFQKPKAQLAEYAPTGFKRTWKWWSKTYHTDGRPFTLCQDPPPPECTNDKCKHMGDWLDLNGLCTGCEQEGHVRDNCPLLAKIRAKFQAKQATAGLADNTSSGN
jgi:hypothetical protein